MRIGNNQNDSAQHCASSRLHHNRNLTCTTTSTSQQESNFSVLHITGYTKSWPPQQSVNNSHQPPVTAIDESQNQFCLIAIARIQVTSIPNDTLNSSNCEFVARTNADGLVTFVDQRLVSYRSALLCEALYNTVVFSHFEDQVKYSAISQAKCSQSHCTSFVHNKTKQHSRTN